ncbi:MAG: FG-GAP repeat domain-containing protein [Bryobacteraceae bacterium]
MKRVRGSFIVLGCFLLSALPAQQGVDWTEDSFEDFADGHLDEGGQNLYVSRDGAIRTIHRFDLNQDGFIDLLFNSTHDYSYLVPATQAVVISGRRFRLAEFAVEGSTSVVLDDLNRDGRLDAVFCPNYSGLQNERRFVKILWGSEQGFSPQRVNGLLPVMGASAIATADLNHDTWPDIAVLNQEAWLPRQPEGKIIRVFWGGPGGFLLTRYRDFGVQDAIHLASADFDGDGGTDLAVLSKSGLITLIWSGRAERTEVRVPEGAASVAAGDVNGDGRPDLAVGSSHRALHLLTALPGRKWAAAKTVEALSASHVALGDLDGDGKADLILTDSALAKALGGEVTGTTQTAGAPIQILWGADSGFSNDRSTKVAEANASATTIGDVDGDGKADLAVAVFQSAGKLEGESVVYFGGGNRKFERRAGIKTRGAAGVALVPREQSVPPRLLFANSLGGTVGEKVTTQLYWGGPNGFDPANRWEMKLQSGYESSAADFNLDGYADLVVVNSGHAGAAAAGDPTLGANILWGSAGGFRPESKRTVLREGNLGSTNIADLNRDGYLDLVLGAFESADKQDRLVIYYGSAQGFSRDHRVALQQDGRAVSAMIADFNRDEWLDIAMVDLPADKVRIYWGSPQGHSPSRQATIDVPAAVSLEAADLNRDGHLDLIVGSYQDKVSLTHDAGTFIFWGSPQGFRSWDSQWLPGFAPISHVVADFDGDGFLDIFSPHYLGNGTREALPTYLYWGSAEGFHPRRRSILFADSSDDGLAADFDRDGKLDLAVVCHTQDGDHHTVAKIFYNDGKRFANPRVVELPVTGPHWMWDQDMGHVANRRFEQVYVSSVFRLNSEMKRVSLERKAETPPGTRLEFAVRSAAAGQELGRQPWIPVRPDGFQLSPGASQIQYRATFVSDNGDRYPILNQVHVRLTP